jgi:hypothetical protein
MWARTKLCVFMFAGMALLIFAGCGGNGSTNPSPTPTPTPAIHNEWTWVDGANVANQTGTYGTQGTAASNNIPGAREQAISWTDASGNFWLFGGNGFDSIGTNGYLNDLWKYSAGQWTWVGGSNLADQSGTYGTQGMASPGNIPGPRNSEVRWVDASGSLWLFGGGSSGSIGAGGFVNAVSYLNDLWKYSAGEWTWMGGSSAGNQRGIYGTQGTAALNNIPGGRFHAVSWADASGSFWLFGGDAFDSNGTQGYLNDLWKYSGGQWTWMGGSSVAGQPGFYGTQGIAGGIPGGRAQAFSWTDSSGNFWLFGGDGYDSHGTYGYLNDLWKYSAGQWTWMGGSNLANQPATYGTQGIPAPGNVPGARNSGLSWTDASGNLWLFGGGGYSSTVNVVSLNDLWKYSGGEWTWVSGSNSIDQSGTYGAQATASSSNVPGGRYHAVNWIDASGNPWLFGGNTLNSTGAEVYLNDLWKYEP